MPELLERLHDFVAYGGKLKGDEKGEAQVFCDRLFQAFGHDGYKEAGAELEARVRRRDKAVAFADLVWESKLLLEMKKRGEKLQRHYQQAFEYWLELTPHRPKYVILCNFDEFWIYDLDFQLYEPIDRVKFIDIPDRHEALAFLRPGEHRPQFQNNLIDVTRDAAEYVAQVFKSLVSDSRTGGPEPREAAQRFLLQCVVAMFSEDCDLLPRNLFSELLDDSAGGQSTFDLLGALFRQMNCQSPAKGGRFKDVEYFNGGLFDTIEPLELNSDEIGLLQKAATEKWKSVKPAIFGTLFQHSMGDDERHTYGAHFTSEADIQKVVLPTIVRPWRERIERESTLKGLVKLSKEIQGFSVLDPACGSGNFLYIAFKELMNLELEILARITEGFSPAARRRELGKTAFMSLISATQFYGIDNNSFAVELAKVTLMLGKRITLSEARESIRQEQRELAFDFESALPLDNLDKNILRDDALFCKWPDTDAIIGNPPYQSKNKMQQEFGRAYLNRLREQFPDVPGRADYCVYWYRRTHDELDSGERAGLVGTNTIRQNYSRDGGLAYIVQNGGTITEAVSSQPWSGDASVHVSIVNWVKGDAKGKKKLFLQEGNDSDAPITIDILDDINSSLSATVDVSGALDLRANKDSDSCDQGQTHGHEGFLLTPDEASGMISKRLANTDVLFPYLTADELFRTSPPEPQRYVIDFHPRDLLHSQQFKEPFKRVKDIVLPKREEAADEEKKRNEEARASNPRARINHHHERFLNRWWLLSYPRESLIQKLATLPRYVVCGQVTKRPIFEFISNSIRPNAALVVFPFADDYSFGVLQSSVHWEWFKSRCSTLTERFRYTTNTVYDSFPWPQRPTVTKVRKVAKAAVELRKLRWTLFEDGHSLRDLYRSLDLPGDSELRRAHAKLDKAVAAAYGIRGNENMLRFLLRLNEQVAEREAGMKKVIGPGLPACVNDPSEFITTDCVTAS